mmetsp:Transcript_13671/g.21703  ORF Transcript_13671/g.21703 Transcript_13671/m.21703 type:complete len:204 (-) Transcript_13671:297-908(-)
MCIVCFWSDSWRRQREDASPSRGRIGGGRGCGLGLISVCPGQIGSDVGCCMRPISSGHAAVPLVCGLREGASAASSGSNSNSRAVEGLSCSARPRASACVGDCTGICGVRNAAVRGTEDFNDSGVLIVLGNGGLRSMCPRDRDRDPDCRADRGVPSGVSVESQSHESQSPLGAPGGNHGGRSSIGGWDWDWDLPRGAWFGVRF